MSALSQLAELLAKRRALIERGVQPMFHGGTYVRGATVNQPLYLAENPIFAESYTSAKGYPGAMTRMLYPNVRSTASPDIVDELIRKYLPQNAEEGYTPASAFDVSLHGDRAVGRLINKLWDYDYDSAKAFDIGMDGGANRGASEGNVLIMMPGTKAYSRGGLAQACNCGMRR